ncbi:MAG: AI-2E family transporter [Flavobacteriales bacterium]|nr:AI-2E family transporter [Flavobacteriales bacterium]
MNNTVKTILGILGFVLLLAGLWYFRSIVSYVVIAAVIGLLGGPVVNFLHERKIAKWQIPKSLAAVVTLVLFIGVVVLVFSLFAPLVAQEAQALSNMDINVVAKNLEEPLGQLKEWSDQFNLSGDERPNEVFIKDELASIVDFGQIGDIFNNFFGFIGNFFIAFFSILFISFFFLKEKGMVSRIVYAATPDKHMDKIKEILVDTKKMLRRYFLGIVIQVSVVTLLVSLGLLILGIENAFLIGFLAGIINIVPYVGPIIGAFVALFITLSGGLTTQSPMDLLALLGKISVVFIIVQLVDNFLIQPYIFSNSVKAHPREIFIVISIAGTLAGVTGMILAIPGYTLIRIVAREFLSGFKVVDSLTKNL